MYTETRPGEWTAGPIARNRVYRWAHQAMAVVMCVLSVLHEDAEIYTNQGGWSLGWREFLQGDFYVYLAFVYVSFVALAAYRVWLARRSRRKGLPVEFFLWFTCDGTALFLMTVFLILV